MFSLRFTTALLVLTFLLVPVVQARVYQGPTYGMLPHEGVFYAREPIYHSQTLGSSETQGYSHSYLSHRSYLSNPRFHPRTGWTAQRYTAKIHHYHRPLLYPGVYRTTVIR